MEIQIVYTTNTLKIIHSSVHKNSIKNQTICHLTADNTNYWILFVKKTLIGIWGSLTVTRSSRGSISRDRQVIRDQLEEHFYERLEKLGILETQHSALGILDQT